MTSLALDRPAIDPTSIFEHFRGSYGTELLTAAVAHFNVFGRLANEPKSAERLSADLKLAERPSVVLFTALRAMRLLEIDSAGRLTLTAVAREHLVPGGSFFVGDYIGLAANSPGVAAMVERLRLNKPYGAEPAIGTNTNAATGTAFIYREGTPSAMEAEDSARRLTLALAGRAKNVAPALAEAVDASGCRTLLDLAGGTGIYSIALVQKNPHLRAIVYDRPDVLKVAAELVAEYGVQDRVDLVPGDMFVDPLPTGMDLVLLSNVLHDWDVPECKKLIGHSASALRDQGRLLIHDVFLNDALDGPLAIALYSAALFILTEGRAYSAAEYRAMLAEASLSPRAVVPTGVHCGLLEAVK
ncbi:MAG TPA: methyltransferase [Pirellulaceae bacterium]|jgi:ubiquinone/menaquinone biosynthesis C-methylase UbiE